MPLVPHKYMPGEMADEELRRTFAARENTLDYLANALRDQTESKTLTSFLITGSRGAGKTTIILMLRLRILEDEYLNTAWLPVRFPEELPAITSLRDLLAAALHVMAEEGISGAGEWYEKVEAETDDEQSQELAISGLRRISKIHDKRLILFVENLDLVFDRGLDSQTQGTLRRLLMDSPFMMIIGTAVRVFPQLRTYDEAFFNYFCPVPLDRLDDQEVRDILISRAEYDGKEDIAETYRRNQGKIKAISRLAGGNPRLILMLYEVLSESDISSTVDTLRSLIDELTPLHKDILEHQFSDQQSKILDAILKCGGTATPTNIAKSTRLTLNKVTTQLARLKEMQIVEVHGGGKGRPAYYSVPDQLFCTWYQMRYLRKHRRRIELFVEVLRTWYDEEERLRFLKELAQKATGTQGKMAREVAVALEHFAASLKTTSCHPEAQELVVRTWIHTGLISEAAFSLAEDRDLRTSNRQQYEAAAYGELVQWARQNDDLETEIHALKSALEHDQNNLSIVFDLGVALGTSGDHATALQHFDRVISSQTEDARIRSRALINRGVAKSEQGNIAGAIADYSTVVNDAKAPDEQKAEALFNRGVTKGIHSDRDGAIADYTAVVEIKGASVDQVAMSIFNRGVIKFDQGDIEGAIADYTTVAEMKGAPDEQIIKSISNRGVIYGRQGDTDGAIRDCTTVIDMPHVPKEILAKAYFNRGVARFMKGDINGAIADYTAVETMQNIPVEQLTEALYNRGVAKMMLGNMDSSIQDFSAAIKTPGATSELIARSSLNRGVIYTVRNEADLAIADFTKAAEADGIPVEIKTEAFIIRGLTRGKQGDNSGAISDGLNALSMTNINMDQRSRAMAIAIGGVCVAHDERKMNRVMHTVIDALRELPQTEQSSAVSNLLQRLALRSMTPYWPRVLRELAKNLGPDTVQRLEVFKPVADILETGDMSKLDPLPPEQRGFVREVLNKFEDAEDSD